MNYTTTTTIATTIDPLLHNMSCDVPHDDQSKIYTYRLTSSFITISTLMATVNFLMMLPTIVMNLFIMIGFIKQRNLTATPSNKLLFSIVTADFLIGLLVEPIFGAHIIQVTRAAHNCGLSNFLIYIVPVTILITMVTHAAISLERYCSVHYRKSYEKIFSRCFVNGFVGSIWALSGLCFVIPLITGKVVLGTRITVALILISMAICGYCYISIYQDSKRQHMKTTAKIRGVYVIREQRPVERTPDEKEEIGVNIRISLFFSKLFLCMLVIYILTLVKNVLNAYDVFPGNGYYTMHFVFDTILFMNALLNPILIFCLNREIYEAATNFLV